MGRSKPELAQMEKQKDTSTKGEFTSATVALESVLLSCTIDAKESRDVAVMDIPGAFLHSDIDDNVFMLLEGKLAELMVLVAPEV